MLDPIFTAIVKAVVMETVVVEKMNVEPPFEVDGAMEPALVEEIMKSEAYPTAVPEAALQEIVHEMIPPARCGLP